MPKARARRGLNKKLKWCFEPSYCRPPVVSKSVAPNEATDARMRSLRSSWYNDMISHPAYKPPPVIPDADRTHNHLFGTGEPPPAVVRRRRGAGDSCDGPRWSPSDCPRPPSVDDFTRTHRNIHGDNQPLLKTVPPADFSKPRTTISGPDVLPPVCCPHPCSPIINEEYERTKYNVIGPQTPPPLRLPVRTDDFVNSKRNLFEPATDVELRLPRRTSDFDDTRRNVFGPPLPFCPRPSPRPHVDTFNHLFGKTILHTPRSVTPPRARRQNINIFSMTGRSNTPLRYHQPRPEMSFEYTYNDLFGRKTPLTIPQPEQRKDDTKNTFTTIFGGEQQVEENTSKRKFTRNDEDTHQRVFGHSEPLYIDESMEEDDDSFMNVFGINRQSQTPQYPC